MGYETEKPFNESMLHVESTISKDMLVGRFVVGIHSQSTQSIQRAKEELNKKLLGLAEGFVSL